MPSASLRSGPGHMCPTNMLEGQYSVKLRSSEGDEWQKIHGRPRHTREGRDLPSLPTPARRNAATLRSMKSALVH